MVERPNNLEIGLQIWSIANGKARKITHDAGFNGKVVKEQRISAQSTPTSGVEV
jgi:hypothetical protein